MRKSVFDGRNQSVSVNANANGNCHAESLLNSKVKKKFPRRGSGVAGFTGLLQKTCKVVLGHWKAYLSVVVIVAVYNLGFHCGSVSTKDDTLPTTGTGSPSLGFAESAVASFSASASDSISDSGSDSNSESQENALSVLEYPKYTGEQKPNEFSPSINETILMPHGDYAAEPAKVLLCKDEYINAEYLFSDPEQYLGSDFWTVPTTNLTDKEYKSHHWATKVLENHYRRFPVRRHIPRLKVAITPEEFLECFMNFGRPVIIPFGVVRALGFDGKGYSLEEYMQEHPDHGEKVKYKANSLHKGKLNLGPALTALQEDAKKKKMSGGFRNFPRNLKLTPKMVNDVGLCFPPYHNFRNGWQLSTMFMGSTTADTPSHSDCCDNFVSHVVGTKRWILAPPQNTRHLKPNCFGGLCWSSCKLPRHPNKEEENNCKEADMISVDVHAGEMLFLPAAWFHAVYNLSPTVMMNNWVSKPPSSVYTNITGLTGGKGSRKNLKCTPLTC